MLSHQRTGVVVVASHGRGPWQHNAGDLLVEFCGNVVTDTVDGSEIRRENHLGCLKPNLWAVTCFNIGSPHFFWNSWHFLRNRWCFGTMWGHATVFFSHSQNLCYLFQVNQRHTHTQMLKVNDYWNNRPNFWIYKIPYQKKSLWWKHVEKIVFGFPETRDKFSS